MCEENTSQKERFLQEVEQKLLRKELDARLLEDGLIRVKWNGQPLCSVDRDGIVRFRPADITGPEVDRQLRTVTQTATQVKEYMRIFECAPALKAVGLEDTYKVLADFGDAVLAGQLGKKGARFVTWEWDFDRQGVHAGHYFMENYGCFYLLLALLLYGIRFHGLHMPVFSEFYVLMFWNLSPIFLVSWDLITTPPGMLSAFLSRLRMPTPFILGLLVVFRFFPTMRAELKGVGRSMKNRGLTTAGQLLAHPVQSMEYVLVPFLLRVLQLADQLSVSAVARGAERPGVRGSYYEKRAGARDHIAAAVCALVTVSYLVLERSMA